MKGVQLKQVDKDYRNHLQAFLNFAVKGEKKVGKNKTKPVYSNFKKFYDYQKEQEKILHPDKNRVKLQKIGELLSRKEKTDGNS